MTDSLFNVDEVAPAHAAPGASAPATQSLSLYRKYRPQSFASDELFGQDHVVNTLRNAIRLDRIAHAYLFCGPRGTGKTTTARILAKAVNCLDPDPANRPCNQCDACRAINANATTDVIEIDAASNRGIDDIRDLRERVKYAPTMLKTKFYIIDEAHQITGAAANAFLKTLEEPPPHTKFVLATTDPEELLQTIVSRCQRFDFRRISLDAMSARLRQVAEAEGFDIDDEAILTIARHATGSLRDALGILDQVAVYREEAGTESSRITIDLVRTVLGVSRNDRVEGMVRAIADQDPGAGLRIINEAVDDGEDVRQLGRQLISYLRVLMLERASGTPEADDTARELAGRFDLPGLARVAAHFADIDYKARHAAIVQLPLELALIQACSPEPVQTPAAPSQPPAPAARPQAEAPEPPARKPRGGPSLRDRVRGASMSGGQEPASAQPAPAAPEPAPAAPEPPARTIAEPEPAPTERYVAAAGGDGGDLDLVVERWDNIRMDVKALNRRTEALLQQADPLHVQDSQLTLVAAYPFHQKRLNDDDTRKVIEGVIERQIGKKLTVICVSRDDAQALRPSSPPPAPPARADAAPPSRPREAEAATPAQDGPAEDDGDPAPVAVATAPADPGEPSTVSSLDLDEQRIEAAMNIFDAVILDDDE
jgi:DNA polymerase-3 subunit gamma/tau